MWIVLSVPILMIFVGGAIATYAFIGALTIGAKLVIYAIYALGIVFFIVIVLGLVWIILIPYRNCESKGAKFFYCLCVTVCFGIIIFLVLAKIDSTDISIKNKSKNEIITEITMIPIDNVYQSEEREILKSRHRAKNIAFTEEMTDKSKKLGMKYETGKEWYYVNRDEEELLGSLWNSESFSYRIPKGPWIIAIQTYNISTRKYYYVIYDKNVFKTHFGEQLNFSYTGDDISLVEREKSRYIPAFVDKHLKKEISKKFEPNLIIITKEIKGLSSGITIDHKTDFCVFPDIKKGKYEFYSLVPNFTYSANLHMYDMSGEKTETVISEEKMLPITQEYIVFYIDEENKSIKQIQSTVNYNKFEIKK